MRNYFLLFLIVFVDTLFLLHNVSNISIGYKEALIYFQGNSFLHYLTDFSTSLFGKNDFALRVPILAFHVFNIFLMYEVGKYFVRKEEDALFAALIYALLPGVNSGAILINNVTIVIFFTLLFLLLYLKGFRYVSYVVLFVTIFIDDSFLVLYLSLAFYGYFVKDRVFMIFNVLLFIVSLFIWGVEFTGKPFGYFLDIFGAYGVIFSPFLFIYFFYAMYRILIKEKKDILWFISFTALVLSLIFSFRQKVRIEDFAAFVVIGVPLMVRVFFASYRIRLKRFRRIHKFFFVIVFGFLVVNFLILQCNKFLFLVYKNPSKHFASKFYFVKELARELKKMGVREVICKDEKLCLRLRFYGIEKGGNYLLSEKGGDSKGAKKVSIRYINRTVKSYYVSKINI